VSVYGNNRKFSTKKLIKKLYKTDLVQFWFKFYPLKIPQI